jgi:hypothetical protein
MIPLRPLSGRKWEGSFSLMEWNGRMASYVAKLSLFERFFVMNEIEKYASSRDNRMLIGDLQ